MNSSVWFRRKGAVGLLGVNAILLGALAFVSFAPAAPGQGFRPRGTYHAVAGNAAGLAPAALFVVDETSQGLIVVTIDPNTKALRGLGGRDLARDVAQAGRGN